MTFTERAALAADPEFVARVGIALITAAVNVHAEAPETERHTQRLAYAARILADPQGEARRMAYGVQTNAAITGASSDSDLSFTVNSLFDAYADR